MIRVLLDTSICIELIRARSPAVQTHLRRYAEQEVGLSTVTLAELEYGVARSRDPAHNQAKVVRFCAPLEVVPFDASAAAVYGDLRADLEMVGSPIGPLDTLIAAHALALDVPLVTCNEREFRRVVGLRVVNWAKS